MRSTCLVALAIFAGCDLPPAPPIPGDTSPEPSCPQAGWVAPSSADFVLTGLQLDGGTLLGGFDPAAVYDFGPSACVDPAGNGAAWTFEVGDVPFGTVTVRSTVTGSLDLATEQSITIDLFGADPPITFTGPDFVIGGWSVDSLTPTFATSLSSAQAQQNGRSVSISFFAEATP